MALLTETELRALAGIVLDSNKAPPDMTKEATYTIADALNTFFDAQAVTINNQVPLPERTTATTRFKQFIAGVVLLRQAGAIDARALRTLIREI